MIITIARQFGSGGKQIGEIIATKLGIAFFDRDLIHLSSQESGIDEDLFAATDESIADHFWSSSAGSVSTYTNPLSYFHEMPMNDKLFVIQSNIIRKIAEEKPCVIVGRCADYILRQNPNVVSIFIHAPVKDRMNRLIHSYGFSEKDAKDIMLKTDKKRAAYYNYYSNEKWGRADNYDLCVNSSSMSEEAIATLIIEFAEQKTMG